MNLKTGELEYCNLRRGQDFIDIQEEAVDLKKRNQEIDYKLVYKEP